MGEYRKVNNDTLYLYQRKLLYDTNTLLIFVMTSLSIFRNGMLTSFKFMSIIKQKSTRGVSYMVPYNNYYFDR